VFCNPGFIVREYLHSILALPNERSAFWCQSSISKSCV